jgi:hypothetical protein
MHRASVPIIQKCKSVHNRKRALLYEALFLFGKHLVVRVFHKRQDDHGNSEDGERDPAPAVYRTDGNCIAR